MYKKLLNKNRGKESVNETELIPVKIDRDASLFHSEIMSDTIDAMKVYDNERDESTKHRFIFTFYPVFTNILFNKVTEIVYKEGDSKSYLLSNDDKKTLEGSISTEPVDRIQAIRNTEYSNQKHNFIYHCGMDIFNNHLFRAKENVSVGQINHNNEKMEKCKLYYDDCGNYNTIDPFNTIGDYCRNYKGDYIKTLKHVTKSENYNYTFRYINGYEVALPLYLYDTIKSFSLSVNDNVKRKDGWVGFTNPSSLQIEKDMGDYHVNRVLNDKEPCQFIDMSPERDLFYFTPKKNTYRGRLEYNWDFCLTYPYKSEYNDGVVLKGEKNGLPLTKFEKGYYLEYTNGNNVPLVMFRCPVRHNLKKGDNVDIKFYNESNINTDTIKCNVVNTGDFDGNFSDRYFSVRKDDFESYIETDSVPKRFLKNVNGFQCEYYFRKFKKISDNVKYTINNLSFAKTIYGDEISQLIYLDDINVDGYKDNMGRPLTELFLTVIKRNQGYKDWYINNIYDSNSIEYSHVFGELTSGLDLPSYAGIDMPVIRYQHNINDGKKYVKSNSAVVDKSSKKLESSITNMKDEFYGDLVEFNPVTQKEDVLENVYYRFNTAQREVINDKFDTIYYDEIKKDLYDYGYGFWTEIRQNKMHEGYANIDPEGYIYNPHFKIKIGEIDEYVNQSSHNKMDVYDIIADKHINMEFKKDVEIGDIVYLVNSNNISENYEIRIIKKSDSANVYLGEFLNKGKYPIKSFKNDFILKIKDEDVNLNNWNFKASNEILFKTIANYSLGIGDRVILMENNVTYNYVVKKYTKVNDFYECTIQALDKFPTNINKCIYFKQNIIIPDYGYILPDGSGRILWRDIKKPSKYMFNDELYKTTFTNGAFYHQKNINFFVKRQDPFHEYGMFVKDENGNDINNNFRIPSTEFDYSVDDFKEKNDFTCF